MISKTIDYHPSALTSHPSSLNSAWRYAEESKRDLRLDFLRGFAVFMMIVDHLGSSSWLYFLTGGDRFFASAAEGFLFISGILVGIIYGDMARSNLAAAIKKLLKRALKLYTLTVCLGLIFIGIALVTKLPYEGWLEVGDRFEAAFAVVTLQLTFVYVDILVLYTLLMLIAPLGTALLKYGKSQLLLGASVLIWIAYQVFPSQLGGIPWQTQNNWFNLAAWQIIFFAGMAIGFHRKSVARWGTRFVNYRYLGVAIVLFCGLIGFYALDSALPVDFMGFNLREFSIWFFSKSSVGPGRLLAFLIVFQFAFLTLTLIWQPLQEALGWLFVPLGQNALYCFTAHVFFVRAFEFAIKYISGYTSAEITVNTAFQLFAVFAIWLMVRHRFLFGIVPRQIGRRLHPQVN